MKSVYKIFLLFCFVLIVSPLVAAELIVENVKDFQVSDWNEDGKTDVIMYFTDGRFGVMLNLSKNDSDLSFSEVKYFSKSGLEIEDAIIKNRVLKTDSAKIKQSSLKQNKSGNEDSNQRLSKEDLIKYINDDSGNIGNLLKNAKPEFPVEKKTENSPEKPEIQKQYDVYDIGLMNFINESDIKFASESDWLKTGIPELLTYELNLNEKIKIMPREIAAELKPNSSFNNVNIVISGGFRTSEKDLKLTVNINNKKITRQIIISGNKDNNGILTLVSQAGKQLNGELRKLLKTE
ncbi:MAG TPA: hypothetical protein PKY81_06620 [bacterium]|nr:hypothetical protein [bacterium]HPN30614.1 hypothetical protein [bacterium]